MFYTKSVCLKSFSELKSIAKPLKITSPKRTASSFIEGHFFKRADYVYSSLKQSLANRCRHFHLLGLCSLKRSENISNLRANY